MTDQPPSGNRWEPPATGQPVPQPGPASSDAAITETAGSAPDDAAPDGPGNAPAGRAARMRQALRRPSRGTWLAGAVAGLLLVAGGFLLGNVTADRGHGPGDEDRGHHGRPFDDDGDRRDDTLPPGGVPGTGSPA